MRSSPSPRLPGFLLSLSLLPYAFITAALTAEPYSSWTWQNPKPQGNTITTLLTGDGFVVAAGLGGTVLRSEE